MPKCEGLPSGPCPRLRNDHTVTWTGCDRYLCADCYNVWWPVPSTKSSSRYISSKYGENSLAHTTDTNAENSVAIQKAVPEGATNKTKPHTQEKCKKSGICSVCLTAHQLYKEKGTICRHGSHDKPCPGSNQLPRPVPILSQPVESSSIFSTAPNSRASFNSSEGSSSLIQSTQDHSPAPHTPTRSLRHPSLPTHTIKHITKAARPECARALANALNNISRNWLQ